MTEIKCIGVLAHPLRPNSFTVAERIYDTLQKQGLCSWVYTEWQEADVRADIQDADMVVAIGGDGAMLRAARVCAPYGVAVLGINMGNLGFLTEIADAEHWQPELERVLAGEYWIEQRMMLQVAVIRDGQQLAQSVALNDVVISGGVTGRMIQLDTYIDADWTTTYNADALVVATATGSTAYALALGGPILPPELNNILIIPSAPHLSMERPIVLSEGSQVEVYASAPTSDSVIVIADGMTVFSQLGENDCVRLQAADAHTRFVRLRGRNYFYRSLLDRLEPRIQRKRFNHKSGEKR